MKTKLDLKKVNSEGVIGEFFRNLSQRIKENASKNGIRGRDTEVSQEGLSLELCRKPKHFRTSHG